MHLAIWLCEQRQKCGPTISATPHRRTAAHSAFQLLWKIKFCNSWINCFFLYTYIQNLESMQYTSIMISGTCIFIWTLFIHTHRQREEETWEDIRLTLVKTLREIFHRDGLTSFSRAPTCPSLPPFCLDKLSQCYLVRRTISFNLRSQAFEKFPTLGWKEVRLFRRRSFHKKKTLWRVCVFLRILTHCVHLQEVTCTSNLILTFKTLQV